MLKPPLLKRIRRGRWVRPGTHRIFKFLPNNPPRRGEHLLVDGVRCRVLRAKVSWDGRDWTLHGVKVVPVDRRGIMDVHTNRPGGACNAPGPATGGES